MGQAGWIDPAPAGSRPESTVSGQYEIAHPISVLDGFGDTRQGLVLRMARWDETAAAHLKDVEADFRIVILSDLPSEPPRPPPATLICVPARPLDRPAAVREAAVICDLEAQQASHPVTGAEATILSQGRLCAPVELRITPQEVFGGGHPRFDLLARELLTCEALVSYLEPLAVALSAPDTPPRASAERRLAALRALVGSAQGVLSGSDPEPEVAAALDRLSQPSLAEDDESFLILARRLYPRVPALLEDVYLLRAVTERPAEAREVLAMRAFISQAAVPPADADLALDKAIVAEQLQFASLIPEPQRLNAARAALAQFRSRYQSRYEAHHRNYWAGMARLHARLLEGKDHAQALEKINTLTELGPSVGEGALAAFRELLDETAPCPLVPAVEAELADSALCPACSLRLDQDAPSERAAEVMQRIERSLGRQMARLSSVGVRQVLERSGDARVERFLKVVQAAQLSSLVEIVDDELVAYLCRFLVESRIGSLLDPILSRLQGGAPPKAEDAQETLRQIARVLQRAFRASGRALPPPRAALKDGAVNPAKKSRR